MCLSVPVILAADFSTSTSKFDRGLGQYMALKALQGPRIHEASKGLDGACPTIHLYTALANLIVSYKAPKAFIVLRLLQGCKSQGLAQTQAPSYP